MVTRLISDIELLCSHAWTVVKAKPPSGQGGYGPLCYGEGVLTSTASSLPVIWLRQDIALPRNLSQDGIEMTVDLVVGKTNDFVTSLLQPRCASLVIFNLRAVAGSVNLNDQFVRNTTEIRDK
jgi:hypothetical protein